MEQFLDNMAAFDSFDNLSDAQKDRRERFKKGLKGALDYTPIGIAKKAVDIGEKSIEARQKRKEQRAADKKELSLAKIAAKKARAEARAQGKIATAPIKAQKFANILDAGRSIAANAMQAGGRPSDGAREVLSSPESIDRLQTYVSKMGETPQQNPALLSQQALRLRSEQVEARRNELPRDVDSDEEAEDKLLDYEYNEEYLPETEETGDYLEFSNFVDPDTWAAARILANDEAAFSSFAGEYEGMDEEDLFSGFDDFGRKKKDNNFLILLLLLVGLYFLLFAKKS